MTEQTNGGPLADALEAEHQRIDEGIKAFTASLTAGTIDTDSLRRAMEGLRRHIYLEEAFLFPPLRSTGMMAAVLVMLREHGELWRILDAIDAELAKGTTGASAGDLCRELLDHLDAHNAKEEAIIYPQADRALAGPAGAALERFQDGGSLPIGWVCAKAAG